MSRSINEICVLENVHKSIDSTNILNGISINLKKNVVTALLGPNGAGKTSTIRVILGLLKPTSGKIRVFGTDVTENPDFIRGRVGLLTQNNAGYKGLSGRQNIEFIMNLYGKDCNEYSKKLDNLLGRLELKEIVEKKWEVLSGGEQRAIGFIRAILSGDELLILDEPTSGLDLARSSIIRKIIQEEIKEGKTILMSSHILTDLEELAKEIIIIRKGKIVTQGSRDDIIEYFERNSLEEAIVRAFSSEYKQD